MNNSLLSPDSSSNTLQVKAWVVACVWMSAKRSQAHETMLDGFSYGNNRVAMRNRCTCYVQSVSNRSRPKPPPKSITHIQCCLCSFPADLGYCGIWSVTLGFNTLLLLTGDLHSFTCLGMALMIYMGPTALSGIRAMRDSNVESQVFTPYNFSSTAGIGTPYLCTTRPTCLTTRHGSQWMLFSCYGIRQKNLAIGDNISRAVYG